MICPRRCVSICFNCCLRSSVRCVPHSSCVCCVPPFLITESSHNHFNYSTSQRLGYVSAEHYYVSVVSLLWKPLELRLIFTAIPPPTAWACTHTRLTYPLAIYYHVPSGRKVCATRSSRKNGSLSAETGGSSDATHRQSWVTGVMSGDWKPRPPLSVKAVLRKEAMWRVEAG